VAIEGVVHGMLGSSEVTSMVATAVTSIFVGGVGGGAAGTPSIIRSGSVMLLS
jgi:hypothetical protein